MPDEFPHERFDRLKKQLQESILRNYPNPERRGCPGDSALRALAHRPSDDSLESDPIWQHVTHCSECYREYLNIRSVMKRGRKTLQVAVVLGVLVAVAIVAILANRRGALPGSGRSTTTTLAYRPRAIDLEGRAITRSENGNQQTKPLLLGKEPEELTVRLPFGSKAGMYEIQLLKNADNALVSSTAQAKFENGATVLTTRVDLSDKARGKYFLGIRQAGADWTYYPAEIQ